MNYSLKDIKNNEVLEIDTASGSEERAIDIEMYGNTVRFFVSKDGKGVSISKYVLVNPGTPKEKELNFSLAITNSDYFDALRLAQQLYAS